jgi:hypothetical protein
VIFQNSETGHDSTLETSVQMEGRARRDREKDGRGFALGKRRFARQGRVRSFEIGSFSIEN